MSDQFNFDNLNSTFSFGECSNTQGDTISVQESDSEVDIETRSVDTEFLSSEKDLESDNTDDEDDNLFPDWEKYKPIQFGDIHIMEGEICICKSSINLSGYLSIVEEMSKITPTHENYVCIMDNIIRAYNFIFKNTSNSINQFRLAFTDLFYRFRHEVLFKALCLSLNLPIQHSDMPFSNFGIESNRTPDLIVQNNGVIYIIEVTATSSIEKAAQSKGMELLGFENKYQKEIDSFNEKGVPNSYMPIFFDMNEPKNLYTIEQFNALTKVFPENLPFKNLLFTIVQSLSGITFNLKNSLILSSSILFNNVISVEQNHKSLQFLYRSSKNVVPRNEYVEYIVSSQIYNKLHRDKQRFYWILDNNSYTDDKKLIFVIDSQNHRITCTPSKEGLKNGELRDLLIQNNNIELLKYIKIRTGGLLIDSTSSEHGVHFYEKLNLNHKKTESNKDFYIPLIASHQENNYMGDFDITKYKERIDIYTSTNYHSFHYDKDYEDKLVGIITEFDTENNYEDLSVLPKGLLGSLKAKEIDIEGVMSEIKCGYLISNCSNDELPLKKLKMKSPFLLPLGDFNESSYEDLSFKNYDLISTLSEMVGYESPYTKIILESVLSDKYKMFSKVNPPNKNYLELESERYKISNSINQLQKELFKNGSDDSINQLSKTKDIRYKERFDNLKKSFNNINKEINLIKRKTGMTQDISYIRLPTKNKGTDLRKFYELEMAHFKDKKKQSTIEGVGIINNIEDDYKMDSTVFFNICEMLTEPRGMNPDLLIDNNVYDDAKLLKDLKQISINNYTNLIEEVKNSALGHACSFVSRMSHSLMFYSQLPFSSDYIRVDNLGYKNALLIVKGGKKIFKSKSSKLFRLFYPISELVIPWYNKGHKDKGSYRFFNIKSINYVLTPWILLHESILTDSISFYPRVLSFVSLNLNPILNLKQQFIKVSINVLLSFHNRRKTEVMLANLRYILLSTLGDFTGVVQILNEFFDFNYDRFQSFLRNSILINYPKYFKTLNDLKEVDVKHDKTGKARKREININDFNKSRLQNIFTGQVINNTEDLALMIYSTFLMTKAPYQKLVERSSNLKGILEINDYYKSTVGDSLTPEEQTEKLDKSLNKNESMQDYAEKLFSNDFNFDAKFCANVGCFIDGVYERQDDVEDIETQWLRILNKPWDEMATSTGLRGDYNRVEDFWGQKGYFVIYKELLNTPGFPDKLMEVFSSKATSDDRRKILKSLNEVYAQKLNAEREFLIFHAVDKVQWRGGREIYVMDMFTKTLQQPIEQFMAVLCKKLDNELISIPSDRRAQVIHHAIFEKDIPVQENLTWYLTLDCSKWAPKSVFIKFIILILNMRSIPNSFKTHFMNYIEKLYYKRVYFNKGEVEVLRKNPKYTDLCDRNLTEDTKVGGYYMEMPYSWVMGIFNYTSSFLHAANQKYISYLLMKTSLISYGEESSLMMFAHSDDSGGRLSVSSIKMAQRSLIIYEVFLKSCNHLLSKKKSVVSRIYFEILSVIYLFNKLLALLPKFLGGLRFLPTDKGPAQDMLQSYSKCIEVMVAGADFNIAYIVMKIYSMMIWRFYYNKNPTKIDYERPLQYLGMPDSHPLFVLLCGSDSDILRLLHNKVNIVDLITFINTFTETMDSDGPIKPLKFEIKVKGVKRGFEDYIDIFREQLKSWSIRNVNYHNTGMNSLSFLRKLNDSGFVGSLVNESTVRRISRGYFLRIGDSAITKMGNIKLRQVMDSINLCQSYTQGSGTIKHLFKEVLDEKDLISIEEDFQNNRDKTKRMLDLVKSTLRSPLKIYSYMDMLTMEGRKIEFRPKTLKPTLIQLVKSSQIFSVDFDPASLVSYIKEPELHWALNNIRGLSMGSIELKKYMTKLGYNIDEVDPDVLLRVCRTFGRENTKNIYIYSRVPGEIRQIKTYSAFLTFLSVNSFQNKEIQGLTIKLSNKEISKEYISPYLMEEVYTVNNILSLLTIMVEKCGAEFVKNMPLKKIHDINWEGGSVSDFINNYFDVLIDTDVRYNILKAQLYCLKIKLFNISSNSEFLYNSAFYTFLKSQKVRSGWYGSGEVYIHIDNSYYSFKLQNNTIIEVYTNRSGKLPLHHSEFIQDVMKDIGVDMFFKKPRFEHYNRSCFGVDQTGDYSIYKGRDLNSSILATVLDKRNDFIDNLESFVVNDINIDSLLIYKGFESYSLYKKINLLPVRKAELVPLIKSILDPNYFEERIIMGGLNNFEDFLYTELLTEYGRDIVIDFDSFIDNYQSSKLYSIFKNAFDNNYSKMNKMPIYSPLPASEGSLVRILIDYTAYNNHDRIINTPTNLDSKMMQLRAEYSDNMATLLGEKLHDYYKQIYSPSEMKEISDHYHNISKCDNIDSMRQSLIKLMTYWGYGSLVNCIQEFTLTRDNRNFKFFNTFNLNNAASQAYSELFPFMINKINELMIKWRPVFKSIDTPIKSIQSFTNFNRFIQDYCMETCMGVYDLVLTNVRHSIYNIQFMNIFLGLMMEEDFIAELQSSLSTNYILSSIPINYKLRFELIATLNVLKTIWQSRHKQNFELNYLTKVQRYPDNVVHFKSLLKEFGIITPPKDVHYNGFLQEEMISFILNRGQIETSIGCFRISPKLIKRSTIEVYMEDFLKHPAPLTADVLNNPLFEEMADEYPMEPIDDETILNLMSEIPKPHYVNTSTKKLNIRNKKITTGVIKWVVDPYIANSSSKLKFYRQCGENIVIITDTFMGSFRDSFPNSGIRIVNYSKTFKTECKTYLLHYSFHKELYKTEFINEYLGGQEFFYGDNESGLLKDNISRNIDGTLKTPSSLGFYTTGVELTEDTVLVEKEGYLEYVDIKEYQKSIKDNQDTIDKGGNVFNKSKRDEMAKYGTEEQIRRLEKLREVNNLIDNLSNEQIISKESSDSMKSKYNKFALEERIPTSLLMLSTISEAEMLKINFEILSNTSGISASDQKKMFLGPENFGLARTMNRSDLNPIKDKKTRAEINSFHPDLARLIGANVLNISKNMKKVVDANYKMWVRLNKTTKTKIEQKNFLLTLFSTLCSNSFLSDDDSDDPIWQEVINKTTVYLSQEDDEEEDDDSINLIFNTIPGSRLLYRPAGT